MSDDEDQSWWCEALTPLSLFCHESYDAKLIVKNKSIVVHKNFLSLVSPVFKAMFEHDTKESKTGEIVIDDFEYDVVKAVINFLYGEPWGEKNDLIYHVYVFCDKYNLAAACITLGGFFDQNVNEENFCSLVRYAKTFDILLIMKKCAKFIASNSEFTLSQSFVKLEQHLIVEILQKASSYKRNALDDLIFFED